VKEYAALTNTFKGAIILQATLTESFYAQY